MQMFRWTTGEFSFEVRDGIPDEEIFSSSGVNPQYLALDFTRIADEGGCETDEDPAFDSLVFDGEGESDALVTGEDPWVAEEAIVTIEDRAPTEEPIVAAESIAEPEPLEAKQEVRDAPPPSVAPPRSRLVPAGGRHRPGPRRRSSG